MQKDVEYAKVFLRLIDSIELNKTEKNTKDVKQIKSKK